MVGETKQRQSRTIRLIRNEGWQETPHSGEEW